MAKSKPQWSEARSSNSRKCPFKSLFNSSWSTEPKRLLQADGFGCSDSRESVRSSVGLPFESRTSDILLQRNTQFFKTAWSVQFFTRREKQTNKKAAHTHTTQKQRLSPRRWESSKTSVKRVMPCIRRNADANSGRVVKPCVVSSKQSAQELKALCQFCPVARETADSPSLSPNMAKGWCGGRGMIDMLSYLNSRRGRSLVRVFKPAYFS